MSRGHEPAFFPRRHTNGQWIYEKMCKNSNHQVNPIQTTVLPHMVWSAKEWNVVSTLFPNEGRGSERWTAEESKTGKGCKGRIRETEWPEAALSRQEFQMFAARGQPNTSLKNFTSKWHQDHIIWAASFETQSRLSLLQALDIFLVSKHRQSMRKFQPFNYHSENSITELCLTLLKIIYSVGC